MQNRSHIISHKYKFRVEKRTWSKNNTMCSYSIYINAHRYVIHRTCDSDNTAKLLYITLSIGSRVFSSIISRFSFSRGYILSFLHAFFPQSNPFSLGRLVSYSHPITGTGYFSMYTNSPLYGMDRKHSRSASEIWVFQDVYRRLFAASSQPLCQRFYAARICEQAFANRKETTTDSQ